MHRARVIGGEATPSVETTEVVLTDPTSLPEDMSLLQRTAHKTHCPYKGNAAYYTIRMDGRAAENAIWTYEDPYPEVAAIKGHLAFYPDRVDRIEEVPA